VHPLLTFHSFLVKTVYTWAIDRIGSVFGTANMYTHVASSPEDCLAQLMECDLLPEGLPVALGGTWADGWAPLGDDELTVEIETDLTCLFRNTLWLHNQAAAAARKKALHTLEEEEAAVAAVLENTSARHQQAPTARGQTSKRPPAVEQPTVRAVRLGTSSVSGDEQSKEATINMPTPVPHTVFRGNGYIAMSTQGPVDAQPESSKTAAVSSIDGQIAISNTGAVLKLPPKARAKSVDRANSRVRNNNNKQTDAPKQQKARAKSVDRVKTKTTVSLAGEPPIPLPGIPLPRGEQLEVERAFRRQRDVIYDKRKRERKWIELEVLQDQRLHLEVTNELLREEGEMLEKLVSAAEQQIEQQQQQQQG
jgi:hypothetical protein